MSWMAFAVWYLAIGCAVSIGARMFSRHVDHDVSRLDMTDYWMVSICAFIWPFVALMYAPMVVFHLFRMYLASRASKREEEE